MTPSPNRPNRLRLSRLRCAARHAAALALAAAMAATGLGAPARHVGAGPDCAPGATTPDKRLFFVSDSVGLGARTALPAAFGPEWQVTVSGRPAWFVENMVRDYVNPAPPSLFGDAAVVAAGYNYPYWDPGRFDRSIDEMVAALRAKCVERIFWVTLREVKPQFISAEAWRQVQPYYWYFPTVNAHLRAALDRHPELSLVDWAANADQPGLTYDAIHLNTAGAGLYSQLIVDAVHLGATRLAPRSTTTLDVTGWPGVPAGAAAVALNITAVAPRASSYVSVFPCDAAPTVSTLNHQPSQVVAAAAIVPVSEAGTVCLYNDTDTHLLVDVAGSFPSGAGLTPVGPARLADTRLGGGAPQPAGTPLRVPVSSIAGDAAAVVLNVTATDAPGDGYVTVAPCGAPPTGTSNVNFPAGRAVPNLAVVAPGEGGEVCVTPSAPTHLIVDVFGALDAGADAAPVTPQRLFDTRQQPGGRLAADGVVRLHVRGVADVPANATGVMLNLTAASPAGAGYLSAFPCTGGTPNASNLNTSLGRDIANFVLVSPDENGEVCIFSSVATDVIVDVSGWTGAAFTGVTPTRVLDTRSG